MRTLALMLCCALVLRGTARAEALPRPNFLPVPIFAPDKPAPTPPVVKVKPATCGCNPCQCVDCTCGQGLPRTISYTPAQPVYYPSYPSYPSYSPYPVYSGYSSGVICRPGG